MGLICGFCVMGVVWNWDSRKCVGIGVLYL